MTRLTELSFVSIISFVFGALVGVVVLAVAQGQGRR